MMKVGQVDWKGQRGVVVIEGGKATVLDPRCGVASTRELFEQASGVAPLRKRLVALRESHGVPIGSETELAEGRLAGVTLSKPIDPPEVWATGVTYRRQAVAHDQDLVDAGKANTSLYSYVYQSYRAEVFFKGFARTTRGPGETVGLRADSRCILPEAELVAALGPGGVPLAFTAGNDLTCWDLELECPLFLSQAKTYDASCSIGPFLVLADSLDPYDVEAGCYVFRGGRCILESSGNTRDLKRSLDEMIHFLTFNNAVPAGSVLFTGTTCVTPHGFTLDDGDEVVVELKGIGRLSNHARKWPAPQATWSPREPHGRASQIITAEDRSQERERLR